MSISTRPLESYRCLNGRLVKGVLTSVDLVRTGLDEEAKVTSVVTADKMTSAQRQVQRAFDRYLEDPANPSAIDVRANVDRQGAAALDVLAPIVAPLRQEYGERVIQCAG